MDPEIRRQSNEILQVARLHGARRVRLFGSRATGHSTATSDIDLVVELDAGRDLLDLIAIKQDLEGLLQCTVDVVEERGLSPYLRDRVLAEAVPL